MLRSFGKPTKRAPSPKSEKQMRPHEQKPPSVKHRVSEDSHDGARRPSSPPSSKSSRRDRSSSDVSSGRSKSRGRYKDDLDKAMFEGTGSTTSAYIADDYRLPKTGPSMETMEESPAESNERSQSAMSGRYHSNSRTAPTPSGYFESRPVPQIQTNAPLRPSFTDLPLRPSPRTPYSAHSTPHSETSPAATPTGFFPPPSALALNGPGTPQQGAFPATHSSKSLASRKRSVNKNLISEPTFLSSTSTVNTVGLPSGASLSNGLEPSPAKSQFSPTIPPVNPRRRRGTTTQTILSAFGRGDKHDQSRGGDFYREEQSTFSDEGDKRPKQARQRLRKSSSEGGSLNARARQQAYAQPSPALPRFPQGIQMEGGMF
jgi:hypothetical protein